MPSDLEKHPLQGMRACLTSKHAKLPSVAPPLREALEIEVFEDSSIDTDLLGTFTGEVERPGSARETVLKKARMGAEKHGTRWGLATEGSFGPHPGLPLLPWHQEQVAWLDLQHDLAVVETFQTETTNFGHREAASFDELAASLPGFLFPSHALIVRPAALPIRTDLLFKGIQDPSELQEALRACIEASPVGKAHVETDMRAHLNPTRQKAIAEASRKLAARLLRLCRSCGYPGWGLLELERGLECESCGRPGRWVKNEIEGCVRCGLKEKRPRPDGRSAAPSQACEPCVSEGRGEGVDE